MGLDFFSDHPISCFLWTFYPFMMTSFSTFISSIFLLIFSGVLIAQPNFKGSDKDWKRQQVEIKNGYEAAFIIRLGDVDNLGFGWPENFDPFCGRMTEVHAYPWEPQPNDIAGMDRILMSSKYNPKKEQNCGGDGYSGSFHPQKSKPVPFALGTEILKETPIQNAYLQIFIDDFQSTAMCSRFSITLNGKRFAEGERILNTIDQTGPVGKLITLPIPEEFFDFLKSGAPLSVMIDETKGSGDGFAIDFVRLLVNRNRENACRGSISGYVVDAETEQRLPGARVFGSEKNETMADADGHFELKNLPTGFEVIWGSVKGYNDGYAGADIGEGDENGELFIRLKKGKAAVAFENKNIQVGESIHLKNILFDQGKADLRPASIPVLDKVAALLNANPNAEIELSGHTSAEGDAQMNRSLSYRRVKACKDYIVSKGLDAGRIIAIGYGPDLPVAPNDTEVNRAKNRRVELRLTKL